MSSKLSSDERANLLRELDDKFAQLRKEQNLKTTLDEVDALFFIKDTALGAGYVSTHLAKSICNRIVDTYMSWINYLHNLIMPSSSMIFMNESKMLSESDKKDALKLISETMALVSENTVIGIKRQKQQETAFIDESVRFWNTTFKPRVSAIAEKIHSGWKK